MSDVLASPLRLPCGAVLPNRLAKASMTEGLADTMHRATQRHVRAYERWSGGGAGLLLTGNVQVDRTHLERPANIAVDGNGGLEELRVMAKAGTRAGNHLWMQINHPGRQTPKDVNPHPLAPSAIPLHVVEAGCGEPMEMTEAQILDVVRRWIHVATVARDTGFTGVQVHAAHGYLLSEFLSSLSNQRKDAWGGNLENRARALLEVVRGVRRAVGRDFPVSVKLNSSDFQKSGFNDEDSMQVVRWLADASVDLIEISGGTYEQPQMIGKTDEQLAEQAEALKRPVKESTRLREAYFLEYARKVRPMSKVPLMITGGFRSADGMRSALKADLLDVVGLARPLCVVPDGCAQLLSGKIDRLPSIENSLAVDRSALGFEVTDGEFKRIEGYGHVTWCYVQIFRFGDGEGPDLNLSVPESLQRFDAAEKAALAAMQRVG